MTKTLSEAAITTREARKRLPAGAHWRGIDPEVHLGYRKGKRGGVWFVRWRHGKGYRQETIGTADDAITEGTLDFNAAVQKARATVEAARLEAMVAAAGPVLTVRAALESYIEARNARETRRKGRSVRSDAAGRLSRHVLGQPARGKTAAVPAAALANVALHALREADLRKWRKALPEDMKATAKQRLVNDVKAALNAAYAAHRDRLPPALPGIIKNGLKMEAVEDDEAVPLARDNQILSDAQVGALLQAAREVDAAGEWDGDLFRLVAVLAATGARFSQVIRLRVGDVQRAQGRLIVPASRKGKGQKGAGTPVPVGTDVLDVLVPAVTGRASDASLLERWRRAQVGAFQWRRTGRGAWQTASELARPWQQIKVLAGLPDVIPYALRHSSIVRGVRANLPIRLVAALHDTSVPMIERHYARWIADGLEEIAARAVVTLLPPEATGKVIPLVRGVER
ncbi:tyrosine-type recombinase/integrase [Zavarzinia compransoris]|uniref:Integrase n=1 Tax=Zavarzinia compransoris TaxID=1264899 RepID=A0A317E5Q3_9PROT|nr:tyrosine-type recombinase/integrase [Zavarzinia compransoris]PWR21684.1 integrase [Zavarzinia compransoris]TDP45532.1 phage integrase family protein [Zavarzinia compransoris]